MHGVINRSPWNLDNRVFLLVEGDPRHINPNDQEFLQLDVWAHVWYFPSFVVTELVGKNIISCMEKA